MLFNLSATEVTFETFTDHKSEDRLKDKSQFIIFGLRNRLDQCHVC